MCKLVNVVSCIILVIIISIVGFSMMVHSQHECKKEQKAKTQYACEAEVFAVGVVWSTVLLGTQQ